MSKEKFDEYLIKNPDWAFAKTMPQWPHHYLLRKNCWSGDFYTALVQHIYDNGRVSFWHNRLTIYYEIGEYQYWTMNERPEITEVINRAKI